MAAPTLMTVDDYFRTPETVLPMELIYGAVRVAEAPTPRHQSAVAALFLTLERHARERGLGRMWLAPLDVVLDERQALIVQPDLMFISEERAWIVRDRVRGAPDLVIEVLSPNPRIGQTEERVRWFAEYGVRECWLVHQDRCEIEVVEITDRRIKGRHVFRKDDPMASRVLPDFRRTLGDLLATDAE